MQNADENFYNRADAHIGLSNKQIAEGFGSDEVSTSFMFSSARFNAWVSASGFNTGAEMQSVKTEVIETLIQQYIAMLEVNMDDYIENFDSYMKPNS